MNQKIFSINKSNIPNLFSLSITAVLISMFNWGCGPSTNFIKTGPSMAAKSNNCLIEVFNSKVPERKYQELGVLESEGEFGYDSFEKILPKLKEEACRNGGDAIIIKTIQKYVDNSNNEKMYVTATVIKWVH